MVSERQKTERGPAPFSIHQPVGYLAAYTARDARTCTAALSQASQNKQDSLRAGHHGLVVSVTTIAVPVHWKSQSLIL